MSGRVDKAGRGALVSRPPLTSGEIVSRWLRWIGYGLLGLVALVIVAIAALYAVTGARFRRTYTIADSPVRATSDSAALARGRHLVEAIGKCQDCHGDDYGGKT